MSDLHYLIPQIAGWWRSAAIYFISSAGGYLTSAIMVPYQVSSGAAVPTFGLLAALASTLTVTFLTPADCRAIVRVEGIVPHSYFVFTLQLLTHARRELLKLTVVLLLAVVIGFLPFVDHLGQSCCFSSLYLLIIKSLVSFLVSSHRLHCCRLWRLTRLSVFEH